MIRALLREGDRKALASAGKTENGEVPFGQGSSEGYRKVKMEPNLIRKITKR